MELSELANPISGEEIGIEVTDKIRHVYDPILGREQMGSLLSGWSQPNQSH
jgi:hypothetical protein